MKLFEDTINGLFKLLYYVSDEYSWVVCDFVDHCYFVTVAPLSPNQTPVISIVEGEQTTVCSDDGSTIKTYSIDDTQGKLYIELWCNPDPT